MPEKPPESEAQFMGAVIELAHTYGWSVASFRPARLKAQDGKERWRTPVQADGAGWPDLVLARPGSPIYFLEVKSESGKVSPEQAGWLRLLDRAGSPALVVRPSDWKKLVGLLGPDSLNL